jgi:ABC-type nitrate/sulfonate/bicarbonate transport system substrate-binding protein
MMTRRLFAICGFLTVAAVALTSCSSSTPKPETLPVAELRQEWFPNANFAGEVSASKRFAKDEKIQLKVVPGAEDVDPIKVVLSKGADFGVVGGDLLVAAVAKGAPLVAIGVVNVKSPTCFLVKAKSGIKGPADFPGKRVGILAGTNTERVYQLMMKRAGIDRAKVKEIQAPFELQTFVLGQYDVRPAFIYDEPVSLEQQNIAYEVIDPAQYGVHFTGTVYFTRRDVLESKRPLAQSLVNSLVKGWQFAIANPDQSLADVLEAYPTLKADRERRSLQLALPYFAGENGKPLTASVQTWQSMIDGLEEIGVIAPHSVKVEQVWDSSLVDHANAK